jgi:hypothetical protein
MPDIAEIGARLRENAGLPGLLALSFDAFDAIRVLARRCEDQSPELLVTFMCTADGRSTAVRR